MFVSGLLCDVVWCVVCAVLCVLLFLCCVVCVVECAVVYGLLLLTVCARADLKEASAFVCFVWDLMCDVVFFICVAVCLCGLGV